MIKQYYIIVNQDNEPERYESILNIIKTYNIKDYTIKKQLWANDITDDQYNEIAKYNRAMKFHGRELPLTKSEISLFMNHISYLKEIKETYNEGYFIIFESDVLLYDDFNKKLEQIIELSKEVDFDIINMGTGGGEIPTIIMPNLSLYKERRNKCTEAIIWSYKGVCKFLEYVKEIDAPIDTKIDVFSAFDGGFNIYWAHPPLAYQGSLSGIFKSNVIHL